MKCDKCKMLMYQYIDKELNESDARSFQEHLELCSNCAIEFAELKSIVDICAQIEDEELPADFQENFHKNIVKVAGEIRLEEIIHKKDKKIVFFRNKYFNIAVSAAAVFLVLFLTKGVFFQNSSLTASTADASLSARSMAALPADAYGGSPEIFAENSSDELAMEKSATTNTPAEIQQSIEPDRSTADDRVMAAMIAPDAPQEQLIYTSVGITVKTADPEFSAAESIKIAAQNGDDGQLPTDSFSIPTMNYDSFIDSLNVKFSQENVNIASVLTTDKTEELQMLIQTLQQIQTNITSLQASSDVVNSAEIAALQNEKSETESKIEALRLGSDYTEISISFIP